MIQSEKSPSGRRNFLRRLLQALAGTAILGMFGITVHAFRIAGGLLLFYIAFEMVFEKRQERHEKSAQRAATEEAIRNLAVFPLAIPLIAGPGAMATMILLTGQAYGWTGILGVHIVMVAVVLMVMALFLAGG